MPIKFSTRAVFTALVAFALTAIAPAWGAVIGVGGATLTPTEASGGIPINSIDIPFVAPGPTGFSGHLKATVLANDPTNIYAGNGGLTFVYELFNTAGATSLGRMTHNDFSNYVTDVSVPPVATGKVPTSVDRSGPTALDPLGAVLGWTFSGSGRIATGQNSTQLVVQTNASAFQFATANVIDGSSVAVQTLGPDGPSVVEPEPATAGVLAFAAAFAIQRRRRNNVV